MRKGLKVAVIISLIVLVGFGVRYNKRIYRAGKAFWTVLTFNNADEAPYGDLDEMKNLLTELRGQLESVTEEHYALKKKYLKEKEKLETELAMVVDNMQVLKDLLAKAQNSNKGLLDDNVLLTSEIANLHEDLRLWEGKINSIKEAQYAAAMRKGSIREIKRRVAKFKKEVQARVDRMQYALGNHGYLFQNGESTLSQESIARRKKTSVVELEKITIEK